MHSILQIWLMRNLSLQVVLKMVTQEEAQEQLSNVFKQRILDIASQPIPQPSAEQMIITLLIEQNNKLLNLVEELAKK